MALFGGVYLLCLIGLLPDETNDSYGRFFAMLWAYLDKNNLPNDFTGHYFMTDFEQNIRDIFHIFGQILFYSDAISTVLRSVSKPICEWNLA